MQSISLFRKSEIDDKKGGGLSRLFVVPDVFPEKMLDSMVIIIHMARSRLKAKL